jgi:hypothetical protein
VRYRVAWPTRNRNHDGGILFVPWLGLPGQRTNTWKKTQGPALDGPHAFLVLLSSSCPHRTVHLISLFTDPRERNSNKKSVLLYTSNIHLATTYHEIKRQSYELLIYQVAKYHNSTCHILFTTGVIQCIRHFHHFKFLHRLATSTECRVTINLTAISSFFFALITRLFDHR